jgi:hypothetical protein
LSLAHRGVARVGALSAVGPAVQDALLQLATTLPNTSRGEKRLPEELNEAHEVTYLMMSRSLVKSGIVSNSPISTRTGRTRLRTFMALVA